MKRNFGLYKGSLTVDLTSLEGRLVDTGSKRGLRGDRDGFKDVVEELRLAVPGHGTAIGVPLDVYEHFLMCNETVDLIDQHIHTVQKQAEVLTESRAFYVDARQGDVGILVDFLKSRAHHRKDPAILAHFEKTVQYNAQTGDKAARTRRQNLARLRADIAHASAPPAIEDAIKKRVDAEVEKRIEAEVQKRLDAYKAELEARLSDVVAKKLAETKQSQSPG